MLKRKAPSAPEPELDTGGRDYVEIIPLGAGQEVGRSCIIVKYLGKTVMLDCGIHPGLTGTASLPFFDEVDLRSVDVALITHFHLDHCAAVPHLLTKTAFKGRVLMTHPTKAIYHILLKDFVKVSKGSSDEKLYDETDLESTLETIELIDFHQTLDLDGIKVTAYRAGHVLGAAMFMVEIGGMRCLYTGDYSRLRDRHLDAADIPPQRPHIVIVESTYGNFNHEPRDTREYNFLTKIRETVSGGGRVLLPVVALGRAQELLLMLEDYWERNPELQGVPIYQASGLARRAMTIYQTYIEMMNEDVRAAFHVRNPFDFKHIKHLKNAAQFDDVGACVVMATPSMLQSGVSRELLEAWCEDEKNRVIIADFAVQGTLAREILNSSTRFITTRTGLKVPLRLKVDAISFSAHADFAQTSEFLDILQPPYVVLVHGEAEGMGRLRRELERLAAAKGIVRSLYMPKVAQAVQIMHKSEQVATVVGRLAEQPPKAGQPLRGVLIKRGYEHTLLHPDDLPTFTKLHTGRVMHRQAVQLDKPFTEVRLALEVMFEGVEGHGTTPVTSAPPAAAPAASSAPAAEGKENVTNPPEAPGSAAAAERAPGVAGTSGRPAAPAEEAIRVGELVVVRYRPADPRGGYDSHVIVEWEGGSIGDMVADAVIAVILQAAGEPAPIAAAEEARRLALLSGDVEAASAAEMQLIAALMRAQFGPAVVDEDVGTITVEVDEQRVVIDHLGEDKVSCSDVHLLARVEKALARLVEAMQPVPLDFQQ